MFVEEIFSKTIECLPNEANVKTIKRKLFELYNNKMIEDKYIYEIKNIIRIESGLIRDTLVIFKVIFKALIYVVNINEVITAVVYFTSNMGTYCYDKILKRENSLIYLPKSNNVKEEEILIRIKEKKIINGLTYLAEMVEETKETKETKETRKV
mgnify:CR=1 FL=1